MEKDIREVLRSLVTGALGALDLDIPAEILFEHPADLKFGDYSTSIALVLGQKHNRNPKELAAELSAQILKKDHEYIDKVEVAGPGFINFYLSQKFFTQSIERVLFEKDCYGSKASNGKKVIVEYTDPNPFKLFHIGHLMSNTIGESISRLYAFTGSETKRACYQGDVGMHVAKAMWGILAMKNDLPGDQASVAEKTAFLGKAYAYGATEEKDNEKVTAEIKDLNKKIYDRSDEEINKLYDQGRAWSLEYFDSVYRRLGTEFDFKFFESETGKVGREVVEDGLREGVFEKSDGAVIFKGERYDLHTRVFLNSDGLPTYEAKELGLAKVKNEAYPYDLSVVVTANEINEYFKVLLKAMSLIFPELSAKTKHIGHGVLRLPTGKMSSRSGDVITAEDVIEKAKENILEKMKETDRQIDNIDETADQIAVGAIKYSILKQDIGKDIIFDFDKSLSFSGDSGPYLQYAYARTQSILEKAKKEGVEAKIDAVDEITNIEKLLYRFPEVVERSAGEYAPHFIATYIYELATSFSSYYVDHQVVSKEDSSPYRVALTSAVGQTLRNGLTLLGIKAPNKM